MGSLAELEEATGAEQEVVVRLPGGRALRVGVRRLTPAESAHLQERMEELIPPLKKVPLADGTGTKEEIDLTDATYQKKVRERQRECRAMACWWCCGLFREEWERRNLSAGGRPAEPAEPAPGTGALARENIVEFVQGRKLPEAVLEQIYYVARAMDLEVMGRVNF